MAKTPLLMVQLELERCPHCSVDRPSLPSTIPAFDTNDYAHSNARKWALYKCTRCGGVILCAASGASMPIREMYPSLGQTVDAAIPGRAAEYLSQAISSIHTPAGAVMLAAS